MTDDFTVAPEVYNYEAKICRVIDGDTVDLEVDLGFDLSKRCRVRLSGINAPELRGKEKPSGKESKEFLTNLLENQRVIFRSENRQDSFGRWLGSLHIGGINVNKLMVQSSQAVFQAYNSSQTKSGNSILRRLLRFF